MPKKPKIDKRLDKLFKDIQPEDSVSIDKTQFKGGEGSGASSRPEACSAKI